MTRDTTPVERTDHTPQAGDGRLLGVVIASIIVLLGLCECVALAPPAAAYNTVSAVPDAPGIAPAGGWRLAYGDAFGAPLGTGAGDDDTLYPNTGLIGPLDECRDGPGYSNTNMEVFNCSQVSTGPSGLQLTCSSSSDRWPAGSGPIGANGNLDTYQPEINYVCGQVSGTASTSTAPSYRFFAWQPRQGETWAFQCVCRFPRNTGDSDPAWWSTDGPWTQEIDFFEGWGWTGTYWSGPSGAKVTIPTWVYNTNPFETQGNDAVLPFRPSTKFHTYTTVIFPNDTHEEFIDGEPFVNGNLQTSAQSDYVLAPAPPGASPYMNLVLSLTIRESATDAVDPSPNFTSGSRTFGVRSISVYEDAAADGANTENAGLAPGTEELASAAGPTTVAGAASGGREGDRTGAGGYLWELMWIGWDLR
jgi:hypothetical protein